MTLKTKETTIWANHMDKRGLDKIRMGWGTICIFTVIMPALVNIKIMIMVINMIIIIPRQERRVVAITRVWQLSASL